MSGLLLGKFESVDELIKAYQNLQSNYTKKCQLISELKQQIQDLKSELGSKAQGEPQAPEDIQSKPQDNSVYKEPSDLEPDIKDNACGQDQYDLDAQIESFFQAYPQAQEYAELIGQAISVPKPTMADFLAAFVKALLSKSPQDYLKDPEFLKKHVYSNEDIKRYFIQSYLDGLYKGGRPISIAGKAAAISITPPLTAKNLEEACALAKKILSK